MSENRSTVPGLAAVKIVAAAMVFATIIYAAIGTAMVKLVYVDMDPIIPPDRISALGTALILIGIAGALASFPVRKLIVRRIPPQEQGISAQFLTTIVSMALAGTSGAMGLVYAILSNALDVPFVLWGISLAAGIIHFPTQAWLEGRRNG